MARQYQIPGGPFINETGTRQYQIPGGPFINETVSAGGGNVSVALTGQSFSASAGSVVPAIDLPLAGLAVTSSAGTVAPALGVALTGQAATFAQGNVGVAGDVTVALTGQSFTASAGSLTADLSLAISGSAATFAQGTAAPDLSVPVTGQAITSAQGNVGIVGDVTVSITGLQIVVAQGSVSVPAAVVETFTGGFWRAFEVATQERKRKLREIEQAEEEAQSIQAQLDREIALLLRAQERKDAERAERERLQKLAQHYTSARSRELYGERVAKAMARAAVQGNFSAIEAFIREVRRAQEEEQFLLHAAALALQLNS